MYLEENSKKKWLVKSENKILGPYSFDQVIDLIRKKQVSLIDEIRDPENRWLYVRENPAFKEIVEERRKEIDARSESTKTYQNTASKSIATPTQKTKTDSIYRDENETNQFSHISLTSLEEQDAVVINETLTAPSFETQSNASDRTSCRLSDRASANKKQYGLPSDISIKKNLSLFSAKILHLSVIAVVAVFISFWAYVSIQKRNTVRQEEERILQIKKYKYLGLYEKAIDLFTKLSPNYQKKIVPDLLEIYPLLATKGLVDAEDINSLHSEIGLSPDQRGNIEIINFWLSMQQQNYGQAQEYLIKATSLQPTSALIKENEALMYLKMRQFLNSFNTFKTLFSSQKNGRYLLGMVQAYYGLSNPEKSQYKKELLSNLEKYTAIYYDFKKELLLAQIALAHELNEVLLYNASKIQFLNTPCRLSGYFIRPGLLAADTYMWKDMGEIKASINKTLSGDELILFQLHDYLEADELGIATEFISDNSSRLGSAAVREQMNLLLFDAQKRHQEVAALAKSNQLDMSSGLNHLLIAFNKIELNPEDNLTEHVQFFKKNQLIFYRDWVELEQLIKKKAVGELKVFIKDHFVTVQNFNPVFVAKSLVDGP